MSTKQQSTKGRSRRLRTTETKPDKSIKDVGTRCDSETAAARISATRIAGSCTAADARVEIWDCGAAGRVFKGAESGGEGIARVNRA